MLAAAAEAGIPIWGDVELAWRVRTKAGRKTAAWITITGTNGKTTTTTMVESMLQGAGLRAIAAGNIGTPILDAVRDPEGYDALAVELSSFQLHWTESVAPVASVCLNLAEDHVDWHGSFDAYAADKAKIYANTEIACVYNAEQIETERMVEAADVQEGCRAVGFTTGIPAISMVGVVEGLLVDRAFLAERKDSATELATLSDIGDLVPRHLVANAAAAAALVLAYGLTPADVRKGLQAYHNGDHRIQAVASAEGVLWVNDSKATNPHAAAASLAAFNPVIWIAGGLSKGVDYNQLVREHAARLKAVVLIGEDSSALAGSLARHAPNVRVIAALVGRTLKLSGQTTSGDAVMAQAVAQAAALSAPGDTVLMAPASASMDQFASYAHRGQAFIDAVTGTAGITGKRQKGVIVARTPTQPGTSAVRPAKGKAAVEPRLPLRTGRQASPAARRQAKAGVPARQAAARFQDQAVQTVPGLVQRPCGPAHRVLLLDYRHHRCLTIIGRMTVLSASTAETISEGKDPYGLFLKESQFAVGGLALMFFLSCVPLGVVQEACPGR